MTAGRIQWTDRSDWNPVRGCTRVNEACTNCYAEILAARFSQPGQWGHGYAHIVTGPDGKKDHRWTGKVELVEWQRLTMPLRWKKPQRCFVNSTSDIFHASLSDVDINRIFAVMALAPHITFQVLTKRPDRMRDYVKAFICDGARRFHVAAAARDVVLVREDQAENFVTKRPWPLPNVHLGVSVHDQPSANAFVPYLLDTPAAKRFVSYEPALGPVDWECIPHDGWVIKALSGSAYRPYGATYGPYAKINQIIMGCEAGPGRRHADPDSFRSTRRQCAAAGTAFFLKQMDVNGKVIAEPLLDGKQHLETI